MEEKNEHIEGFLNLLKEDHNNAYEKINQSLLKDISKIAELSGINRQDPLIDELINGINKRLEKGDKNQITDLFIYFQKFHTNNEEPVSIPSKICISIGKLFTNKNLEYTARNVYSQDGIEGTSALLFLILLAKFFEYHRPYVLNFIKENFKGFSQNQKTECVFQLKNYLPDDEIAQQIISDSGISEYKLIFSTEEDSTSKPITFKLSNEGNGKNGNLPKEQRNQTYSFEKTKSIFEKEKQKSKPAWWQFWKK